MRRIVDDEVKEAVEGRIGNRSKAPLIELIHRPVHTKVARMGGEVGCEVR